MAFFGPGSDQNFRPAPSDALVRPQSHQPIPGPLPADRLPPYYQACHEQPAMVHPKIRHGPLPVQAPGYQIYSSFPQASQSPESGVPFPPLLVPPPSHFAAAHPFSPPPNSYVRAPSGPSVPFRSADPFQSDPFRSPHPLRLDPFRPNAWRPEPPLPSWSAPRPRPQLPSPYARPPHESAAPWRPQLAPIPRVSRRPESLLRSEAPAERPLSAEDLQGFAAPATLVVSGLVFSVSVGAALGSLVTLVESALRARALSGGVVGKRALGGRRVLLHCSNAATAAAITGAHQEDRDGWRLLGTELEIRSAASLMRTQAAAAAEPAAPGTEPAAPVADSAAPRAAALRTETRAREEDYAARSARTAEPGASCAAREAEPAAPGTEACPPEGSSPGAFERVSMEDMEVSAEEGNAAQGAGGGGFLGEAVSEEKGDAANDFGKGRKRGVVLGSKHAAKILAQRTPGQEQRWQGSRLGLKLAAKIWGREFEDEAEEPFTRGLGESASGAESRVPKRKRQDSHNETGKRKRNSEGEIHVEKRHRDEGDRPSSKQRRGKEERPRGKEAQPSSPLHYPVRTVLLFPVIRFPSTREVYATLRDNFAVSPDRLIRAAADRVEDVRKNDRDKEFTVTFTDRETAWRVLETYGNLDSFSCHYSSREKLFYGGKVVGVYPGEKSFEVQAFLDGRRSKAREKRSSDGMVGKAEKWLADESEALSKKRRRAEADRRALKRDAERRAKEKDVGGGKKGVRSAVDGASKRARIEDKTEGTERKKGTERKGRSERTVRTGENVLNGKGGAVAAKRLEGETAKARVSQGPERRTKDSSRRIVPQTASKIPTLSKGPMTKALSEPRRLVPSSREPEDCTSGGTEREATEKHGLVKVEEGLQEARTEVEVAKKPGLQQERFVDEDFDLNL